MTTTCEHLDQIRNVTPSARGCEDCLRIGDDWLHLRLCLSCGHVGCCDDSKNKHATRHYHASQHPIIHIIRARRALALVLPRPALYGIGDTQEDHDQSIMKLPSTMTTEQAAGAALDIKPAVVYPYHYRGPEKNGWQDPQKFKSLAEAESKDVRLRDWYAAQSRRSLSWQRRSRLFSTACTDTSIKWPKR